MKYWIILTSLICLGYSQEKSKEDKFLNIKVQDVTAQGEIDALRKEYLDQKKTIVIGYKEKIKTLKNEQKEDMKSLKKSFRQRLREVREKYKHVKFSKEKEKKKVKPKNKENTEKLQEEEPK
ncbi:MAG: hypothetical protein VX767_01050 [Candidatus Neomarinimicrobiota bacterium]|nr:hypothetical protein [Candidatus Neomarinimicrobiota bacterium]